jgi:hypothetical protein
MVDPKDCPKHEWWSMPDLPMYLLVQPRVDLHPFGASDGKIPVETCLGCGLVRVKPKVEEK